MNKTLLSFLFSISCLISWSQTLNQAASWPNTNWTLTGNFDTNFLDENPTLSNGSSSFSFNDDNAGSTSINSVAAESPFIDLTVATNAVETELFVTFAYVLNIFQTEELRLQFWNADSATWSNWGAELGDNSAATDNFCNPSGSVFTSTALDVSGFTPNQLQNFRYRVLYDDNSSFGWGFCADSPTIFSGMPPACPTVQNLNITNVSTNNAMANWSQGSNENSWEVAIRLASEGPPTSGMSTTNPFFNISGLMEDTDYVFYVRANCANDGFSNWAWAAFTTGTNGSGAPVTFTPNTINTSGIYDRGLVDLNGDFLDDIVSVGTSNVNIHYQLSSGGFNVVNVATTDADFLPFWSLAAADYDKNGINDLLYGDGNGVTFMRANSDGSAYSEISGPEDVFSQRSNFVDIDNDGNLDAFVCHDVEPNVYYLNDGSGNLTYYQGQSPDILPNGIGLAPFGGNYGSVWIDFDNDRDMDLFLAKCRGGSPNETNTNELWRNDGNGTFINVADGTGWYNSNFPTAGHDNSSNLGDGIQTWSSAWADFDNDGDMDVYVGASSPSNGNSKLMRNNGDGTFTDVTSGSGVLAASMGIENAPADFDNDGFIDIMTNGDVLFNNGDFTFTNFSGDMPDAGAIGDANDDGFLDVFRDGTLYINNTSSNNWIKINTIGTVSNINGIGARVELHTSSGIQIRDVRSGEGFRFMSSLNTHFGIGTEVMIDEIIVYWPSGIIDTIPNPTINSTLSIVEGSSLSVPDESLADVGIYPNPVKDVLTINTNEELTNRIATVFDSNGKRVQNERLITNALDVSPLQPGVYFLRIEHKGKSITRKFIKD